MSDKVKVSEIIKNGVKITTYTDGSQHFELIKQSNEKQEDISLWQKIKGWFIKHEVRPYVKIRDLADPIGDRKNNLDDIDAGQDGKNGYEIGIKGTF